MGLQVGYACHQVDGSEIDFEARLTLVMSILSETHVADEAVAGAC